jgi:hypothetical protein
MLKAIVCCLKIADEKKNRKIFHFRTTTGIFTQEINLEKLVFRSKRRQRVRGMFTFFLLVSSLKPLITLHAVEATPTLSKVKIQNNAKFTS